ncbi:major facilitator family transporter [Clostridium bornimense]|uniref:Major facilitator family transporter n=1 Tax=Clostridium bornimense TaxID=1216932 RepID=W6SH72_9CLOT|nr:MFS transporter [Clostridium bornimense]CDM69025.1 major facilitator family transporter [Clostridium bornimense]
MRKKSMKTVVVLTIITTMVCNMAHPVTPMVIKTLKLPSYMFGIFFAAMSIGNFLCSPIWGKLSDKMGRRKFLIIGILGYGVSQLGFGYSENPIIIVIYRFLSGAFVVSFLTVILAYIADITDKEKRLNGMMYYGAASTIGSAIGSLLGGIIGNSNYKITFLTQFILSIIVSVLMFFFLEETVDKKKLNKIAKSKDIKKNNKLSNILDKKILFIMSQVVIFYFASTSYNSTITYYIEDVLNLPPTMNGVFLASAGVVAFLTNLLLTPIVGRKLGEIKGLKIMTLLLSVSMAIASISTSSIIFFIFIIAFVSSASIYVPLQQNIISKLSVHNNGEVAGIQNSSRAIGMIIGSLYSGFIFDFGNKLPFLTVSIVTMISFVILQFRSSILELN